jgi:hypothetical protein
MTIKRAVELVLENKHFVLENLSKNLINLSALARDIQPQVESLVEKKVKRSAIVMAIKRASKEVISPDPHTGEIKSNVKNITIRTNLVERTYENSPTILGCYTKLINKTDNLDNSFCNLAYGVSEATLIVSKNNLPIVDKLFEKEKLISNIDSLAAMSIQLPEEVIGITGAYYQILKALAWENINVVEIFSTYTELTLIFHVGQVDRAFSVVKSLN